MKKDRSLFVRIKRHVRKRLLSGVIFLIPLGITLFALRFLFRVTAGIFTPTVKKFLSGVPDPLLIFISIIAFGIIIYLIGFITTFLIGRRLIAFGESIIMKLPLLNTIYGASKKVVSALSLANKSNFKSVVFIEFPRPGVKSIGFITGSMEDEHKRKCYTVIVPTAPNPTSGFLQIISCEEVIQTNLSIEDGIKMIVSGGMIGPDKISEVAKKNQHSPVDTLAGKTISV